MTCIAMMALLIAAPVAAAAQSFDSASVKANNSNDSDMTFLPQPGRFVAVNVTAARLITYAHGIRLFQLEGASDWRSDGALGPAWFR